MLYGYFTPDILFLKQAQENIGMVMIFTLVSAAQEWINLKSDDVRIQKIKREEEKKIREEEEERVCSIFMFIFYLFD